MINSSFFSFKNFLEEFPFYESQNNLQGWLDRAVLAYSDQEWNALERKDFAQKTTRLFKTKIHQDLSPRTTELRKKIRNLSDCLIGLKDARNSDEERRIHLQNVQDILSKVHTSAFESLMQDPHNKYLSSIASNIEDKEKVWREQKEKGKDLYNIYLELAKSLSTLSKEEKWKFPDERFRIAFAKLAAQENNGAAHSIENYGIKKQSALIEIAKLALQRDGASISQHIKNFGIEEESDRIEIAKLAAQKNGWVLSECIESYGIEKQSALIEIAKLAVQENGWRLSEHIKNYGIRDQSALIEIAKLAAQQNGCGLSKHIENYGIEEESDRIEIAKLAAQKNAWGVSEYIQKYSIENQSALVEIAKLAAQYHGWSLSQYIKNYGIEEESDHIEIAKLAAQQNGLGLSECIKNYGIENQSALVEIAKLAAQQNGRGLSEYIENYGIKTQSALIEIAKFVAEQDGWGLSEHIQKYGIEKESARIEIAKLVAQQINGWDLSEHIEKYGIEKQSALIEIAKLAAQQDGCDLSEHIEKYGIEDQVALEEIAKLAIKNDLAAGGLLHNYGTVISEKLHLFYLMRLACSCEPLPKEIAKDFLNLIKKYSLDPPWIKKILSALDEKIKKAKNEQESVAFRLRKQRLTLFFLVLLEKYSSLSEEVAHYLSIILEHRNLPTALFFAHTFLENLRPEYLETYTQLISNAKKETLRHLTMPMVVLSQWSLASTKSQGEIKVIKASLEQCRTKLRDAKGPMESLLQAMRIFEETSTLNPDQKIKILHRIFQASKQKGTQDFIHLQFLLAILPVALKNPKWGVLEEENWSIESLIKKILGTSFEIVEKQLAEGLTSRGELVSLVSYVARLQTLSDSALEKEYKRVVQSVFTGTIAKARYETEKNPHLQMIAEKDPELFHKWQQNRAEIADLSSIQEADTAINFFTFLKEKILIDEHFPQAPQVLRDFLQEKHLDLKEIQETHRSILALCQALCSSSNQKTQIQNLKELENELRKFTKCEFHNDIAALRKNLEKKQQSTIGKDTDDWRDLLLCGTEVLGSCQRIDGNPELNKCLLAYILDGKNRLLALKDPHSEKIVARAILRLLWDPEKERPALFQERYYPSPCSKEYQNRLDALARERAHSLGIDWFKAGGSTKLISHGSCSPYEFSDAGGGVTNGTFTVSQARRME